MYHLSQSALVTLLASDWTTLQIHYMPTLEDCKPQIATKGIWRKLYKPPDAPVAPDASPCPATAFPPERQVATSRRVPTRSFPASATDPAPENCPMVLPGAPDMTTPTGPTHGHDRGPLWPKAGLPRTARTGPQPADRTDDYAATAGAAAIAAFRTALTVAADSCSDFGDTLK